MKATIYWTGDFGGGPNKTEVKLLDVGTKPYAQHASAAYAVFVPKGKRKPRQIGPEGFHPYILVLEGWDHPEPDDCFTPRELSTTGCVVRRSRYTMFDERYQTEFDAKIDAYIAQSGAKVVADYRWTKDATYVEPPPPSTADGGVAYG
jgi:hypothetical protein